MNELSRYIGGQIEVQNARERYLYRGEIKSIIQQDDDLIVTLVWFAKRADDGKWDADDSREYIISMMIYSGSEISEGRFCLRSGITGETTVLFPVGGSTLDPSQVRGFVRA